ncbi:MAG TPA: nucleotide sugar dehydrogenase [Anaerolineae bacterium]|nr:nucleotide sugar dehydrogenase [Anaerolineae bacterium]
MQKNIQCILIKPEHTIRQAMEVIEKAPHNCGVSGLAVVVDENQQMIGVVTDGDIRSAILHHQSLDDQVSMIMTSDPIAVTNNANHMKMYEDVVTMLNGSTRMLDRAAGKIIVVDEEHKVVDVVSFLNLIQQADIKTKKIAVIGLGFVGLTLAVVLADVGFTVLGVELRDSVRKSLEDGKPHFYEAGLANQLRYHIGKRMQIAKDLAESDCDVYVISVGTPVDSSNQPILDDVRKAVKSIAHVLKPDNIVMLRSTVPVGTTRDYVIPILEEISGLRAGKDFSVVFAPERTVAGKAIKELRTLPQVIGATDSQGAEIAAAIFREMTTTIVRVDSLETAEMVKLINNSFRDLIFSFSNEIALLCEHWNLDAYHVIEAANEGYPRDPVPYPSPGVGGVCLKKDPHLLYASANAIGHQSNIFGISRRINEFMPTHVMRKFENFCRLTNQNPAELKVLVVGLAFKGWPETSDMRDSTGVDLVKNLQEIGVKVLGYDPVVSDDEMRAFIGIDPVTLEKGFISASAVFVMNNHPSYEDWNLYSLLRSMNTPGLFFDGWRMFHEEEILRIPGISYSTVSQNLGWPE